VLEEAVEAGDHEALARVLEAHVAWQKSLPMFWLAVVLTLGLVLYGRFFSVEKRELVGQRVSGVSMTRVLGWGSLAPIVLFLTIHFWRVSRDWNPEPG